MKLNFHPLSTSVKVGTISNRMTKVNSINEGSISLT